MNIKLLSTQYKVKKISDEDIKDVLELCKGNPLYYQYCPPSVSIKGIRSESLSYLKSLNYKKVKLAYVKNTPQAKAFWEKNHFVPAGTESQQEHYTVVPMERIL